ncbi:DUF5618 family protein [Parasediminibacterium sp. JCM 36343]|uniref:DUF5618 family protein n=1 Tax=Parasediminibacterium sp. JCM 36343 TaxID=3374279 RepID=UPI003979EFCF
METQIDYISEAKRYIANAKEILKEKAKKHDGNYTDPKYIKMAGHTAYAGVLVALDGAFGKKGKGRKDVDWYKERIAGKNKKLIYPFLNVYEIMHLCMGYDGVVSYKMANFGFEEAEKIITAFSGS